MSTVSTILTIVVIVSFLSIIGIISSFGMEPLALKISGGLAVLMMILMVIIYFIGGNGGGGNGGKDRLGKEEMLKPGESLSNGDYTLKFSDGKVLQVVKGSEVIWDTGAANGDYAVFQGDGNFVLYRRESERDHATWATGTNGEGKDASYIKLESNGQLKVYDSKGSSIWESASP